MTEESTTEHHDAKEEVELIYDPVLNCYYDHRTHTYYELKNWCFQGIIITISMPKKHTKKLPMINADFQEE